MPAPAAVFLLAALMSVPTSAGARPPAAAPPTPPRQKKPVGLTPYTDVEYANVNGKSLMLDVFVSDHATEPRPLVVWFHGGGWQAGSKERCPALLMLQRGYTVASVGYRLTDVACWPAQIHDCKAAIRYLRANAEKYKIDPNRIGVWGASAGGHLVSLLGTSGGVKELEGDLGNLDQSSAVQCVCDWFGPSDFTRMPGLGDDATNMVAKLLCGPMSERQENAKAASPVTYCSADDPPFLIMHGTEDKLVSIRQSEMLRDALQAAGASVTLDVRQGAGHGTGFGIIEMDKVVQFFDEQLKPWGARAPSRPSAPASAPSPGSPAQPGPGTK